MKGLRLGIVGSALALALVACGGAGGGGGKISGTVTAPSGGSLKDAILAFCPVVGSNYSCKSADGAVGGQFTGDAPSAQYETETLPAKQYVVIAQKDVNGDGNIGAGDYGGVYSSDGKNITPVTPPATGINIQMVVLTGGQSLQGTSDLSNLNYLFR